MITVSLSAAPLIWISIVKTNCENKTSSSLNYLMNLSATTLFYIRITLELSEFVSCTVHYI